MEKATIEKYFKEERNETIVTFEGEITHARVVTDSGDEWIIYSNETLAREAALKYCKELIEDCYTLDTMIHWLKNTWIRVLGEKLIDAFDKVVLEQYEYEFSDFDSELYEILDEKDYYNKLDVSYIAEKCVEHDGLANYLNRNDAETELNIGSMKAYQI